MLGSYMVCYETSLTIFSQLKLVIISERAPNISCNKYKEDNNIFFN